MLRVLEESLWGAWQDRFIFDIPDSLKSHDSRNILSSVWGLIRLLGFHAHRSSGSPFVEHMP